MDTLSADGGILSRIGALELGGDLESHGDGVLESAWHAAPTNFQTVCCTHALCIGDGALEAAVANGPPGPTIGSVSCIPPTAVCR
jgi:hypothetical protein